MARSLRDFSRNEEGGILVVTAIILPVILMISALCVDVGLMYIGKSRAERVALVAAESGLERLPSASDAEDLAVTVALAMLSDTTSSRPHFVEAVSDGSSVQVLIEIETPVIFGGLFGNAESIVRSSVILPPP